MMVDGVEADDLISLAVQDPTYKGWHKIIVSSDKDFYQLCDDETVVHQPYSEAGKEQAKNHRGVRHSPKELCPWQELLQVTSQTTYQV